MCISLSSIKISFVLNLLLGIVVLRTSKGWWQTEYGPAFKKSRLIHSRKIVTIEQMPDKTNPGLQGVFLPRLVVTVTLQ